MSLMAGVGGCEERNHRFSEFFWRSSGVLLCYRTPEEHQKNTRRTPEEPRRRRTPEHQPPRGYKLGWAGGLSVAQAPPLERFHSKYFPANRAWVLLAYMIVITPKEKAIPTKTSLEWRLADGAWASLSHSQRFSLLWVWVLRCVRGVRGCLCVACFLSRAPSRALPPLPGVFLSFSFALVIATAAAASTNTTDTLPPVPPLSAMVMCFSCLHGAPHRAFPLWPQVQQAQLL